MRIGLAYNEKPDANSASDDYAEWDDPSTIDAVEEALSLFGNVVRLEADEFLPQKLSLAHPEIVFNMAEGLHGPCRESHVPALCEYLNIPYTGSDPLTLALTLHKGRTKEILAYRGRYAAVGEDLLRPSLVKCERQCQRVGAGIGDVQVLAQRRHVRLAAGAVQALGHVEDNLGVCERKFLREEFVRFESNDVTEET